MFFRHSMNITQQLMPIYNITVHENKLYVALNVAKDGDRRHQHVTRVEKPNCENCANKNVKKVVFQSSNYKLI